jgi:hypothetical protein
MDRTEFSALREPEFVDDARIELRIDAKRAIELLSMKTRLRGFVKATQFLRSAFGFMWLYEPNVVGSIPVFPSIKLKVGWRSRIEPKPYWFS